MNSAPTPLGPYILWAVHDRRSTPSAATSSGILPTACAASVWRMTLCSRVIRPISASGWIVPTSLFAAITLTSTVSGVIALRTASGSTRPVWSTGRIVSVQPCFVSRLHVSSTDLCSMPVVTRWLPRSAPGIDDALDGEVVRFGRAASEHDFVRGRADQRRDLLAGPFDGFVGVPPEAVAAAGGVAKVLGEVRQHRLEDARVHGCGGVVVEIDGERWRHGVGMNFSFWRSGESGSG